MMGDIAELSRGAVTPAHDEAESDDINKLPDELDKDRFDRGRYFFQCNLNQCLHAMLFSLIVGLSVNNLLETLVATGRTSKPKQSFLRYIRTTFHVLKWHYGNVWDKKSSARKSILDVRKYHNVARAFMHSRVPGDYGEISDDSNKAYLRRNQILNENPIKEQELEGTSTKVYVSQYDMSLVQCGFMGAIIMYPDNFGIKATETELEDYVYFWRWIGWLLGIEDKNNICAHGYKNAIKICKAIEIDIVIPSVENPPQHFYMMAKAFTDGMNQCMFFSFPVHTPECFIAFVYECAGRQNPNKVSFPDRVRLWKDKTLVYILLYVPGIAWMLNRFLEFCFGCKKMS